MVGWWKVNQRKSWTFTWDSAGKQTGLHIRGVHVFGHVCSPAQRHFALVIVSKISKQLIPLQPIRQRYLYLLCYMGGGFHTPTSIPCHPCFATRVSLSLGCGDFKENRWKFKAPTGCGQGSREGLSCYRVAYRVWRGLCGLRLATTILVPKHTMVSLPTQPLLSPLRPGRQIGNNTSWLCHVSILT